MNAHRINYRPAPSARRATELALDLALCCAIAAGIVLSILQPWGAIL